MTFGIRREHSRCRPRSFGSDATFVDDRDRPRSASVQFAGDAQADDAAAYDENIRTHYNQVFNTVMFTSIIGYKV